jgi:hypothetical protein
MIIFSDLSLKRHPGCGTLAVTTCTARGDVSAPKNAVCLGDAMFSASFLSKPLMKITDRFAAEPLLEVLRPDINW